MYMYRYTNDIHSQSDYRCGSEGTTTSWIFTEREINIAIKFNVHCMFALFMCLHVCLCVCVFLCVCLCVCRNSPRTKSKLGAQ